MSHVVDEIVRQIASLDEADSVLLEEKLSELEEHRWQKETQAIRRAATERGIDQSQIDAAIRDLRHKS